MGIPSVYQSLAITVEIARIILYCMTNNLRSHILEHLFVFDEGSLMFPRIHEMSGHLLLEYMRLAREYGCGFLVASQNANVSDSVLSNTSTKLLIGGAGLGHDFDVFASATGMTQEQKEFAKRSLFPGLAVAKDPRWPYPFTVEIPRVVL